MAIADELVAILAYDLRGENNLKRFTAGVDGAQSKLVAFAAVAGKLAGVVAGALAASFGTIGVLSIKSSAQMEGFLTSLETIEGSSEKAKASMDWIREFAKVTPYELDGVTESFIKLKSYGIDPIANNTLRTLGDMASAMNKPLDQAVEAFADASTFEFERLKEFGIKAKQEGEQVTFTWTENNKEMSKNVKKTATDVRKFLLDVAGKRFGGAMEKQSKTFNGMMSNLKDSWEDFQRRVGEKGFFDVVKKQLEGWLGQIDRLDKNGKLDKWAKGLSDALSTVAGYIAAFASRTSVNIEWILDNFEKLKTPLTVLAAAIGAMVAFAFPVATALVAIGLAVDDLFAYLQGGESYLGEFLSWLQKLEITGQIKDALAALGAEVNSLIEIVKTAWESGDWTNVGQLLGKAVIAGFKAIFAAGDAITAAGADLIGNVTNTLLNADWAAVGNRMVELIFRPWGTFLQGFFSELTNSAVEFGSQIGTKLGDAIYNGLAAMGAKIRAWFDSLLPDWARGIISGGVGPGVSVGPGSPAAAAGARVGAMIGNANANLAKTGDGKAMAAVSNDNRQDNRNQPFTVNTTVNQTVTQAANAPGQAAQATGAAVSGAVASQRSQVEQGPAF